MASEDVTPISFDGSRITFSSLSTSTFTNKAHHNALTQGLATFRQDSSYTDLILKINNTEIKCHKVVLAAASKHFHNILKTQTPAHPVELRGICPEVLETMVDYLYTGELQITTENVQGICQACDKFGLTELRDACDSFISSKVEAANCMGLFMFANIYALENTRYEAWKCMQTGVKEILHLALESEYRTLSKERLLELVSSDDLQVEDESLVYELAVKWIRADTARERDACDILQYVRLPLCSADFLIDVVDNCPLFKADSCQKLINEAKIFHMLPNRREAMSGPRTKPRKQFRGSESHHANQLVALGKAQEELFCWVLAEDNHRWDVLGNMKSEYPCCFQACVAGGDIVVTGGQVAPNLTPATNNCWAFSIRNRKWRRLPPMLNARSRHTMTYANKQILVFGGYDGGNLSSAERLSKTQQNWIEISPMPDELFDHLSATVGHQVFVMGGYGSQKTWEYQIKRDQWEQRASMPCECDYGCTAVLKNDIYVLGTEGECCLRYNTATDTWANINMPQSKLQCPALCPWNERILLSGGRSGWDSEVHNNQIEEYDPELNIWSDWKYQLPECLSGHFVFSISGV